MPDVLIELFSEEIPARMQARASADLRRLVTDGLVEAGLTYASAGAFATPRRLALSIEGLTAESRAVREERKGPRVDAPEAAVDGFLRSTGLTRDRLEARGEGKAAAWFAVIEKPGRRADAILAEVLERTVRDFPWPKSMRWGAGSLRWVRPLHSILCIASDEGGARVVPVTVDHLTAGDTTEGHRFLSPGRFAVTGFDDYAAKLRARHVMLDPAERQAAIWNDATNQAFALGLEVVPDDGLLAEVAGLVEWPVVLMGEIGARFLDLPAEVLQTSMREHQKFFSVRDPRTGRIERFVTVANRTTADHGAAILSGNRRVLAARLSDATFFWENDLRVARAGMGEWAEGLRAVTFHNQLGSQADRIKRIAALARELAPAVGADPDMAERAARLAKLDLRSAMVGEFPELQGTMGVHYARAAGEPEAVALAAKAHYQPLGPSDAVPTEPVSVAVALADKIDTLTGFWAIDEKPTGSKDPFALRRAALGVVRLIPQSNLRFALAEVCLLSLQRHRRELAERGGLASSHTISEMSDAFGEKRPGCNLGLVRFRVSIKDFDEDRFNEAIELNGVYRWTLFPDGKTTDELHEYLFDIAILLADLLAFLHDRLKVHLRDRGIPHDVIDACLAPLPSAAASAAGPGNDDLTLLVKRAEALAAVLKTDDGANLLQGFRRANNILTQAEAKDGVEYSFGADPKFAETDAERALFAALDAAEARIAPAMAAEDFGAAMAAMAALRGPTDAFFDAVQVNSDNPILRRNRLNLLHRIRAICGQVADLTKLEG